MSSTPQSEVADESRVTNTNDPEGTTILTDDGESPLVVTPITHAPASIANKPSINTEKMSVKKYTYSCIWDSTLSLPNIPNLSEPTITSQKDIEILLDVHEYKPEGLKVTRADRWITVEGKHAEKMDDDTSLVSQQFTVIRKYYIPKGMINGNEICTFSSDGVLRINVSKICMDREVPIIVTNKPAKVASGKAKVLKGKLLQKMKNQTKKIQDSKRPIKIKKVEKPVSPKSGEVPETKEQEHPPEESANGIMKLTNLNV